MVSIKYIPFIRDSAGNTLQIGKKITNFKEFGNFCREMAVENTTPSIEVIKAVKRPLMMLEDAYKEKGGIDVFCIQANDLANELHSSEHDELANIIFSEVVQSAKNMSSSDVLFDAINNSIEISKVKNDTAHVVGGLTQLANLYEALGKKNELYKTLKEKKTCLREILDDYESAKRNYATIVRPFPEERGFILQMAFVMEKLAKLGKNNKQNKADKYYKEVEKLYKQEDLKRMELYIKNAIDYKNRNLAAEGRLKSTHTSQKANKEAHFSIESNRRKMKKMANSKNYNLTEKKVEVSSLDPSHFCWFLS